MTPGASKAIPAAVEWRFDKAQLDWKPAVPLAGSKMAELERTPDALRQEEEAWPH